jgi:hypothetical protein
MIFQALRDVTTGCGRNRHGLLAPNFLSSCVFRNLQYADFQAGFLPAKPRLQAFQTPAWLRRDAVQAPCMNISNLKKILAEESGYAGVLDSAPGVPPFF